MNTDNLRSTFDVISIGESMGLVRPDPPAPLSDGPSLRLGVAGAESNVVTYLALLGARAAWGGRIGTDPFGELVRRSLAAVGADISLLEVDPDAPTGVYFKDPDHSHTEVYYYRDNTAASLMGRNVFTRLPATRVIHLTGITPALSDSCLDMMVHALIDRPVPEATMSFDVNYRPKLWPVDTAASVLRTLAGAADLVFVGRDEAEALWGTKTADDIRLTLPDPHTLVVKDGEVGATVYKADSAGLFVEAPLVKVVEPVGAGDAFAAGYLFGQLRNATMAARLRMGHLMAASALRSTGDIGQLPGAAQIAGVLNEGSAP